MVFDESKDPQKHMRPPRPEHAERDLAVRPTRENGPMGRRGLEGDVRAGMAQADDEHGPVGELRRIPVLAGVDLSDPRIELPGDLRDRRHREGASRHDHLARPEAPVSRDGDEIVAADNLYGGTYNLFHYTLPKLGITVKFVDGLDPASFGPAIDDRTKAVFFETIGNPRLDVHDIRAIADVAHAKGVPVLIDNTFAPLLTKPIEHGADIVIHSATKWIGGHGTSIGGAIIDGGNFDWGNGRFPQFTEPDASYHGLKFWDVFADFPGLGNVAFAIRLRVNLLRDIGATLSPFNAQQFLLGIETLGLRVERHSQNALAVAKFLSAHPKVAWVTYPGLENHPTRANADALLSGGYGGVVVFGVKGGLEAGQSLIENVKLFSHLANVGDAKSLIIHPATTTHSQLNDEELVRAGIGPDFVRLSVGIEDINDIIADLEQALEQV
jgi:O-acetylhomoserine (thiol)-lyase